MVCSGAVTAKKQLYTTYPQKGNDTCNLKGSINIVILDLFSFHRVLHESTLYDGQQGGYIYEQLLASFSPKIL